MSILKNPTSVPTSNHPILDNHCNFTGNPPKTRLTLQDPLPLNRRNYTAMAMAHMPPLRILCFGNSLTSGYHAWGSGSHPYSIVLSARLRDAFPGRRIEVSTSGVPGDVVCGPAFHERMSRECKSLAPSSRA